MTEASTSPTAAGAEPLIPASPRTERRYDRSIAEGPLLPAVWKIAWPTMLQNMIGGLQGVVDHAMVGHYVGFLANAAIGVSWQIFLVVVVFMSFLFTGMSVLVARFAGAGQPDKVDRTVYQAFLTAIGLALGGPGAARLRARTLAARLRQRRARGPGGGASLPPDHVRLQQRHAGLLHAGGSAALGGGRAHTAAAGNRTDGAQRHPEVVLIRGLGPIPAFGTAGAAMGSVISGGAVAAYALVKLWRGGWVVAFPRRSGFGPDWGIVRALFRFGLPTGIQGIAMNLGGMLLLAFVGSLAQSSAAQAAYAVAYTELFSFITWTSVGLMGAAAAVAGQSLGAENPERAKRAVHVAARIGLIGAGAIGVLFLLVPSQLLALFGMTDPVVVGLGVQLLRVLSLSGFFITTARSSTPAASRAPATPRARSTSRSSRRSSFRSVSASSSSRRAPWTRSTSGSRSCAAT